ncbi:MAG: hypothetical protein U0263_19835 [Polyangiaceae bacterium]
MRSPNWLLALLVVGCLPDDTRKPPGRVDVTATSDYSVESGFDTDDGWHVSYDRFLVALGEVELRGDDCSRYNDTDYARVLDARREEPQKVSTPYAFGTCDFQFRMRPPPDDAVLGEGVSASDLAFLRQPGTDAFAEDTGSAVFVSGRATQAGVTKRFEWSFRLGAQYEACRLLAEEGLSLASDDVLAVDLSIRSEVFFQSVPNSALTELRFAPFASADDDHGNSDGEVTLAELSLVPLEQNAAFERWQDFGDYVYTGLVPKLPRYRGVGVCDIGPIREGGHGPGNQ